MAVIEWETNAVQTQTLEECSIFLEEEVFQKLKKGGFTVSIRWLIVNGLVYLIEEELRFLFPNNVSERGTDLEFAARIS